MSVKRLVSVILASLPFLGALALPVARAEAATCHFDFGFKALHDAIPDVTGDCLEDEHYNPANGDGLQETARGLLVWRKRDNWTAFTDGYHTWIAGPLGLQERLNAQRFDWEAVSEGNAPASGTTVIASSPATSDSSVSPGTTTSSANVVSNESSTGTAGSHVVTTINVGPAGGTATVWMQTAPNADCTFSYTLPNGTSGTIPGLGPKTADANGLVSWSWNVDPQATPGTVTIACNGQSVTTQISLG